MSTRRRRAREIDELFAAAVDATEEAVLNTLWSAETTTGREGRTVEALPHDAVLELLGSGGPAQIALSTSSAKPSVSPPSGSARRSRMRRAYSCAPRASALAASVSS